MSYFIGRPPFSNALWVGIETMQFHIAQTKLFLRTPSFPIQGVPMNNLAPMKNCPGGGVQGNLNWMPGYKQRHLNGDTLPYAILMQTRKFRLIHSNLVSTCSARPN